MEAKEMRALFKEHFGFIPPCQLGAAELGDDMGRIFGEFHQLTWQEGHIPLKYRYLMALATAVYGGEEQRARLELLKALRHGATRAEVVEVLQQQVWLRGAPLLAKIIPLLRFAEAVESRQAQLHE